MALTDDANFEAPLSSVNQSSCYKQYTISGLSLEPVTLGKCAQVSEVEINGIKFTGTAMPSYQMDGSKIEQNVVQASESSSIVETEGSTLPSLSTSACPVSSDTRDDGYGDSYRGWYDASMGVGFAKIIVDGLEILDLAAIRG